MSFFFEYKKYIQQNDITLVAFLVSGWWGRISFLERRTPVTRRGPKTMLGASRHVNAYNNQSCVPVAVINMLEMSRSTGVNGVSLTGCFFLGSWPTFSSQSSCTSKTAPSDKPSLSLSGRLVATFHPFRFLQGLPISGTPPCPPAIPFPYKPRASNSWKRVWE